MSPLYVLFLRSKGIFYCTIFFSLGLLFWELEVVEVSKWGRSPILGGRFFNFCKLGGSNQKMLVSNLEELKKIGEVSFEV